MSKAFTKSFEVRWDDVDANGHLRNTRYLEYAATARLGFLMEAGWTPRAIHQAGVAPVTLSDEVRYLREVFPAEAVTVDTRVIGLSQDVSRWRFEHILTRESGEKAAEVRTLGAWIDLATRKIAAPPAELQALFETVRTADCQDLTSTRS
ncbi:thioesterase [Streptomyces sp. Act143]|uniref:acyl-CoA thioesterase n=1 Tax=Streptomyces sp. Act143 TaxID=2200760 RepID=UPI000D682A5C|nr:thioesterase [Streptomyces sp. Act143]